MAVKKRKQANGQYTRFYHYRFMIDGKLYNGPCEGCEDEESALAFENKVRSTLSELSRQKSVKAIIENFRDELAGGIEKLSIDKVWDHYLAKPRRFSMSERFQRLKQSQFTDFIAFLHKTYPEVKYVNQITRAQAEAYLLHLRKKGRYQKKVVFSNRSDQVKSSSYRNPISKLSTTTTNCYHKTIREVLNLVGPDAGLTENPFSRITLMVEEKKTREAFTQSEIETIIREAPQFVRAIFIVGLFTALRAGDIATLRWSDVVWDHGIIRRKLSKTKNTVEIPIMQPLREFLISQMGQDEVYVLPEHAAMYQTNPTGLSYRVKKYLKSLGITTNRKVEGRTRTISVKDIHSLRHTFCYLAGVAGIPLVVVQSIVGHMTPEMTSYYSAHADRDTKREKMEQLLPQIAGWVESASKAPLGLPQGKAESSDSVAALRARIIERVNQATPATLEEIQAVLESCEKQSALVSADTAGATVGR